LGLENIISEVIIIGLRNDEITGRNFINITASISPRSNGGVCLDCSKAGKLGDHKAYDLIKKHCNK
jgi:hypothetical protein